VYELTGDFPGEERFGLTNQMRCAAVSISSNIAEGSSGASRTDFARFVEIATGSLFEVASTTTKRHRVPHINLSLLTATTDGKG
jgi:four helix bundle protein